MYPGSQELGYVMHIPDIGGIQIFWRLLQKMGSKNLFSWIHDVNANTAYMRVCVQRLVSIRGLVPVFLNSSLVLNTHIYAVRYMYWCWQT